LFIGGSKVQLWFKAVLGKYLVLQARTSVRRVSIFISKN
jgi:hypothetical protein